MLAQTIILFITGIIVFWYTLETRKIRKETAKQQLILAQQLVLLQEKDKFERQKEISFVQPIFRPNGGTWNDDNGYFYLINNGEAITNITFESQNEINATITPTNSLDTSAKLKIEISAMPKPRPSTFPFIIGYDDKLGNRQQKQFEYRFDEQQMIERS